MRVPDGGWGTVLAVVVFLCVLAVGLYLILSGSTDEPAPYQLIGAP